MRTRHVRTRHVRARRVLRQLAATCAQTSERSSPLKPNVRLVVVVVVGLDTRFAGAAPRHGPAPRRALTPPHRVPARSHRMRSQPPTTARGLCTGRSKCPRALSQSPGSMVSRSCRGPRAIARRPCSEVWLSLLAGNHTRTQHTSIFIMLIPRHNANSPPRRRASRGGTLLSRRQPAAPCPGPATPNTRARQR